MFFQIVVSTPVGSWIFSWASTCFNQFNPRHTLLSQWTGRPCCHVRSWGRRPAKSSSQRMLSRRCSGGSQKAAENGEEGGDKPNTQQFQDGKSRRACCETNPGRCRYLSLLIPSGMCLKDLEGFIALSFGPSVFD